MSDDFCVILYNKLLREGQIGALDILRIQHNEHRQGVAWCLMLLLAQFTDYDCSAASMMGLSFLFATALVCLNHTKKRLFELSITPMALIPVAYLICSVRQTQTLLAVYQDYFPAVFFLVSTLVLLDNVEKPGKRLILALVTGISSAFCFGNGLLALPLGAVLLTVKSKLARTGMDYMPAVRVVLIAFAGLLITYFWHFNFHSGEGKATIPFVIAHPFDLPMFFIAFLGGPFCYTLPSALFYGSCLLILLGITLFQIAKNKKKIDVRLVLPMVLILFAFCSGGLAALGRVQMGLDQAITSRYTTMACYSWVGTYLLVLYATALKSRFRNVLLGLICGLIVAGLLNVAINNKAEASAFRDGCRINQEILRTYRMQGVASLNRVAGISKPYFIPLIEYLEANKMAPFSSEIIDVNSAQVETGGAPDYWLDVEKINGRKVGFPDMNFFKNKETDLVIRGWAIDHSLKQPPFALIVSIDGKFDMPTVSGLSRTAVSETLSMEKSEMCGFESFCDFGLLSKGEHKIFLKAYSQDYSRCYLLPTKAKFTVL